MKIHAITALLAVTLGMNFMVAPATAAEPKESKHKLSEWKIGSLLFGEKVSKSSLKGKVVVIENWGVNCPPCIASLPHLAELERKNRDKGLCVIGAESQGSSKEAIEPLLTKAKVEYTITSGAYGPIEVTGIPRIFVFDRDGLLVFDGHPADDAFEKAVKKALRQTGEAAATPVASRGPLIPSRAWTNSDGKSINAAVVTADDTKVTFMLSNGKKVDYQLVKLSDDSREVIEEAVKNYKAVAESEDQDEE